MARTPAPAPDPGNMPYLQPVNVGRGVPEPQRSALPPAFCKHRKGEFLQDFEQKRCDRDHGTTSSPKGKTAISSSTFLCLYFFILKNVQLSEARGCQSRDVCFCPPLVRVTKQGRTRAQALLPRARAGRTGRAPAPRELKRPRGCRKRARGS